MTYYILLLPSVCDGAWVQWLLPVETRLLRAEVGHFTAYVIAGFTDFPRCWSHGWWLCAVGAPSGVQVAATGVHEVSVRCPCGAHEPWGPAMAP